MSRKADLEELIRESYALILEYQGIVQLSSDPKEKARAQREIRKQWELVEDFLEEYRPLAVDGFPQDVAEIAVYFDQQLNTIIISSNLPSIPQNASASYLAIDPLQTISSRPLIGELCSMTDKALQLPTTPIDFVIITPLEEERDAILAKLPHPRRLNPLDDNVQNYYQAGLPTKFPDGSTGIYHVIVMPLLGMGRVQAAIATTDAIQRWRPRYVILVGIAGGVSTNHVNLGDIVIPDKIVDYELQKQTAEKTDIRWEVYNVSPKLLGAVQNFTDKSWINLIAIKRPQEGRPIRHISPIASGDKVIDVAQVLENYRETWSKLIGVEMEAGGAAVAAFQAAKKTEFFMIRGVSDLADGDKNAPHVKEWRPYACDAAAAFTVALLQSGPISTAVYEENAQEINEREQASFQKPITIEVEPPDGAMDPDSQFYIERTADDLCWDYISKPYATTLFIQAPRQTGKSSLMHRIIIRAERELNKRTAFIDLQEFPKAYFEDADAKNFLRELCLTTSHALGFDEAIDKYWETKDSDTVKCGLYLSDYIIPKINEPFILAIDEVNRMLLSPFSNDFFGMLRVWHNKRARDASLGKMTLFLSSSTEPFLLAWISHINRRIEEPNSTPIQK